MHLSIVVPCYNEEESLEVLAERLRLTSMRLDGLRVEYVLVDDGSTDGTFAGLTALAEKLPGARVVLHERNRGLGAALRTGMAESLGDVVVTMDSDCTYDPVEIPELVQRLRDADVALGSPYHPEGGAQNVPPHRLALSMTLSRLYRIVLRRPDLHTFTSMFRAYTREATDAAHSTSDDYLALTEMLVSLIDGGFRIVEHPTVLHVRVSGVSKLRVARMVRRHALMVARLSVRRAVSPSVQTRSGGSTT